MGTINRNIRCFSKFDKLEYHSFLKIKFDIFYREFNWKYLSVDQFDGTALPDNLDEKSLFFSCLVDGVVVAIARVSYSNSCVPHMELYQGYLETGVIGGDFGVVNSIAVIPRYRGRNFFEAESNAPRTIGEELLSNIEIFSINYGCNYLLLTAGHNGSEKFFAKMGYSSLCDPYEKPWSPVKLVDYKKNLIVH